MKDSSPNQELFEYYDERAPEYEDFYRGKFPAKVPDPAIYQNDTINIQKLLPGYISGKCIDLACGTGFWLPVYEKNCTKITLIDQSENVLAECRKKIQKLGIGNKTEIIRNDIFGYPFSEHEYDSVLMGFVISHFTETGLDDFFRVIRKIIRPGGRFIIMDSVWNEIIAKIRSNKAGLIKRSLKDGRKFEIFKRYFEKQDLHDLAEKHNINLAIVYWGKVFFLAAGNFSSEAEA
jgi:demethylmenaquinone methyltransferase/2-methoxy-6-polyprenyl-1,4-benzoquinol methylase